MEQITDAKKATVNKGNIKLNIQPKEETEETEVVPQHHNKKKGWTIICYKAKSEEK